MRQILLILIVFGALLLGALNYHVILLDDSLKLLKKSEMTLESTFVDARGTKKFKRIFDPLLIRAGFKALLEAEGIPIKAPKTESNTDQE
jgi:hypothetical protein